jgi:putative phage-type endonuclease
MSFGNLNLMLNNTIIFLEQTVGKDNVLKLSELYMYKNQVYNNLLKEFTDVTPDIVDEIFSRLFVSNYKLTNETSFDNGINSFREFEENYPDIKIPPKYKKLFNHFEKLKNLPQPVQRSKEWYDYRYNRITASDTAAAIDLNPYEPVESFILKKCDPNFPFRDNATVFHGRKYEPTATMIYEHIYNTRVFEFGALPSDVYTFLGASPDGISSQYTLDNKFSKRLGTMLEIKCPVTREIQTRGKIIGTICPFYYYCQVQQQLACCNLDICDFWQCKLSEYKTREEYLSDNCKSCVNTEDATGTKIDIDNRLKKGIFLEFYPKNFTPEFEGDLPEWKSQYIIPKRLDMDESQYDAWTTKMLDQYKTLYPEIAKDYYFYRVIYWKLNSSHNVSINRDDTFLSNIIPILQETWAKIIYYREHQDKLDELIEIGERRKKYIRFNTGYTIHNEQIVNNKFNILDKSFDLKKLFDTKTKTKTKTPLKSSSNNSKSSPPQDYDSDYCDFIDNEECDFIDTDGPVQTTPSKSKIKTYMSTKTKTIKHTVFSKDKKPTKPLIIKTNCTNNNDNEVCDFLDD